MSQISVKPNKDSEAVEFEINLPELDEENPQAFVDFAEETWADEEANKTGLAVICAHARSSVVVSAQSYARGMLKKVADGDIDEDTARTMIADWTPNIRRPGKSSVDKATDLFSSMSDEDKARFMQQLEAAE